VRLPPPRAASRDQEAHHGAAAAALAADGAVGPGPAPVADVIYGAANKSIPKDLMANANLARIIHSDEVQSALNPAQRADKKYLRNKNLLVNIKALVKLDAHELWCEKIEVYWSWNIGPCKGQGAATLKKSGQIRRLILNIVKLVQMIVLVVNVSC
jgi:hypothetical protein